MTVKAIRHHQSFAGRDADDAHAQYLLAVDANISDWDDAYTHSQVTNGNPHSVAFCELAGSLAHAELTGRDAVDAHTQYLRLANTSRQTMSGSLRINGSLGLDLGANPLVAGSITGYCGQNLIIKPCDSKASHITLMGACGCNDSVAGNVYLKTGFNRTFCKSGHIFLLPGDKGKIYLCSDTHIGISSDCTMDFESRLMCFYVEEFLVSAEDIKMSAWGELCLLAPDSFIDITAPDIYLTGDVTVNGPIDSCCAAKFDHLLLCGFGEYPLLRLHNNTDLGESCTPFIDLVGCECDSYSACNPVWVGSLTGKSQAKYCLDGGIYIQVNGCQRFIKFHRPLL